MAVDLSNLQFNNPLSSLQSPITSGDSSQQPWPFQPAAQSQPASFATPSQTSTQSSTPLNNMLQHGQDLQNRIAQSSTAVKSPTTTPPIDFSSALKPASWISFNNPLSALQSPVSSDNSQVKAPTWGWMMPPTPTTQPLSNTPTWGGTMAPTVWAPSTLDNTPTTPTPTQWTTGGIIPTASAWEPDPKFTDFVTKAYQAWLNDTEVKQAVDMAIKNGTLTDPNASNNQSSQDALWRN